MIVLARDADAAARRFGVSDGKAGVIHTRTGRAFFADDALEAALVVRIGDAAGAAGLWDRLRTDWLCLDTELLPCSAKAQSLIDTQYRPVGEAGMAGTGAAAMLAREAAARGVAMDDLPDRLAARSANASAYDAAWRRYVRPVTGIDDLRIAPFHLLASEGAVHADKPHDWHMTTLGELAAADPALIVATAHRVFELAGPAAVANAVAWWEALTGAGGEGMVVKPVDFVARGRKGISQPAIKCRGPEYLRIIYGPDYTQPEHLERLRQRGLGTKRGNAIREFALGLEALERFVAREPLRRVHECIFAILALESEPIDPRL